MEAPELVARFCLATWGPREAVAGALLTADGLLSRTPPQRREAQLRLILRAVVEAGGRVQHNTDVVIAAAVSTGYDSVLADVLALLAAAPGGVSPHVAACCSCLVNGGGKGWYTAGMARMLVAAVRSATEGEGPHVFTWDAAMRNVSCSGTPDALEALAGLLSCGAPLGAVQGALHLATKTPDNHRVLEMLLGAGASVRGHMLMYECFAADPWIMRMFGRALAREGDMDAVTSSKALQVLSYGDGYGSTSDRVASAAVLVSGLGADPQVALPVAACRRGHIRGRRSGYGYAGCGDGVGFDKDALSGEARALCEALVVLGADADAALAELCRHPAPEALRGLPVFGAKRGAAVLLSLALESEAGAAGALRGALARRETAAQAEALLASGSVGQAGCAAMLAEVIRGSMEPGSGAVGPPPARCWGGGGEAAVSGDDGDEESGEGEDEEEEEEEQEGGAAGAAACASGPQPGGPAEQQQQPRRRDPRRWETVWALAAAGCVSAKAGDAAMVDACCAGDAEAVRQLACCGLAGEGACMAGMREAARRGHAEVVCALVNCGAVPVERQQASQG